MDFTRALIVQEENRAYEQYFYALPGEIKNKLRACDHLPHSYDELVQAAAEAWRER